MTCNNIIRLLQEARVSHHQEQATLKIEVLKIKEQIGGNSEKETKVYL